MNPPHPTPPQRRTRGLSPAAQRIAWALLVGALALMSACATVQEPDKKAIKKAEYHYKLGANYFAEHLIPQSIRELLLSLEQNPHNPDAHHLLGFIYMGRRNYPEAIRYFRTAIEQRPDFYICLNNLGTAFIASARWEEAVALYEDLVTKPMYNTPELAYNNLGWAYYNLGQYERAQEHLEMAVFLKEELCLAYNNLGLTYLKLNNPVGADRAFNNAITRCPHFTEPHFHLAQLMRSRNDPRARFFYQRCYEMSANSNWGDRCRSYLEVMN